MEGGGGSYDNKNHKIGSKRRRRNQKKNQARTNQISVTIHSNESMSEEPQSVQLTSLQDCSKESSIIDEPCPSTSGTIVTTAQVTSVSSHELSTDIELISAPILQTTSPESSNQPSDLQNSLFYSVPTQLMDYLLGRTRKRHPEHHSIMARWREDHWNHLIDPPPTLLAIHYCICLPSGLTNLELRKWIMKAANNLATARYTSNAQEFNEGKTPKEPILSLPYPEYAIPQSDHANRSIATSVTAISDMLIDLNRLIQSIVYILKSDIHRHYNDNNKFS